MYKQARKNTQVGHTGQPDIPFSDVDRGQDVRVFEKLGEACAGARLQIPV